MNIKVLVLDTQVYSNTGGQSSTASYMGQNTKFSVHGKVIPGKIERRKELANICMMHPNTFVAQTSCAMTNHFYKSILAANEYDGPAVVSVYTTCQPEQRPFLNHRGGGIGTASVSPGRKLVCLLGSV